MRILVIILCLVMSAPALAAERSRAAVAEFKRQHPCPATGKTRCA